MRPLALLLCLTSACGGGGTRQVRVVPDLSQGSTSCPADTRSYKLDCVDALVASLIGKDGQRFASQCTPVKTPYDSLQAFVSSATVVDVLNDVKARSEARLELRAYHQVPDHGACDSYGGKDDYLLFWGMSPVTDFTDGALAEVSVAIDCRPQCDCGGLASGACPDVMPPGICAPPENRPCRKQCETADNCYAGLLSCEIDTCAPSMPETAKCCTPVAAQVCAACAHDSDCESGICAHNTTPGVDEWFCASPCPPLPDVTNCASGMSCKRLDNGVYVRAP